MKKKLTRRRRLILDSGLQYRMVTRLVVSVVAAVVLFSTLFVIYYWVSYMSGDNLFKEYVVVYKQVQTVKTVKVDGVPLEQRYYETLAQPPTTRLQLILPALLVNNLLIMFALAGMAFLYSHKLAGPVYRIKGVINRSLAGDADQRIYLREGDELKDLAEKVNALLERLDRFGTA
ncbi:MAG TPA: methyl-accepting chemotaxis protein [Spirochaetia bacterium]|nr:methyl-accepting chemotaxis protein [Spirochaetia bacterium]